MVLSVTVVRVVTEGWGQGFPRQLSIRKQEENRTIRTFIAAV